MTLDRLRLPTFDRTLDLVTISVAPVAAAPVLSLRGALRAWAELHAAGGYDVYLK